MDFVIDSFGACVRRNGELFVVKVGEQTYEQSARKVRSLIITEGVLLSSDVIKLAMEHNIDVIFCDKQGEPIGLVWHATPSSTAKIRRQQLRIADNDQGVNWAKLWIRRKLENQISYLSDAREKRTRLSAALTEKIHTLQQIVTKIDAIEGTLDEMRGSLLGLEGSAGQCYWQAVNLLLPEQYHFNQRSRNPAQDEFNCLLNYAYGILYSKVTRACLIAGLDPYVGFIHTDNYNKESLVFDLIECYRIWADEVVLHLFATKGLVKEEWFFKLHNGLRLDQPGKHELIQNIGNFLTESILYKKRKVERQHIIQLDCHAFASELLELAS